MPAKTGSADLPLHGGYVPTWLHQRMAKLGRVITEAIVWHYGPDEMLRRLAHPFWFQSFGSVMGMDWHSSGITTSVMGALKKGLQPIQDELGLYICGGKGKYSRETPNELLRVGERTGCNAQKLVETSRLVAKVDTAAIQDGFDLYLHNFVVTHEGHWAVVQQGMNPDKKEARRYHWLSEHLNSYVEEPHAAVDGPNQGIIVNLTDRRANTARKVQVELVAAGPDKVITALRKIPWPHLQLPAHHEVRSSNILIKRLHKTLAAAHERGPVDFKELLMIPGLGARTVFAIAMVAEVVHGVPARFSDPARFSLALGGKDRHPYPVPLKVYDETIRVLKEAIQKAKLGNEERLSALRRLDQRVCTIDRLIAAPRLERFVKEEWQNTHHK